MNITLNITPIFYKSLFLFMKFFLFLIYFINIWGVLNDIGHFFICFLCFVFYWTACFTPLVRGVRICACPFPSFLFPLISLLHFPYAVVHFCLYTVLFVCFGVLVFSCGLSHHKLFSPPRFDPLPLRRIHSVIRVVNSKNFESKHLFGSFGYFYFFYFDLAA